MISELRNLPAPAKLNLFLHVTGRRADGYHLIETVFELIDLCDSIDLCVRLDRKIELSQPTEGIAPEANLVIRAARALASWSGGEFGATITLRKNIPIGGGLGGGSSDAATVLCGLNLLWGLKLPLDTLAQIGLTLGADVPFFVFGQSAFATGIGEKLLALTLPKRQYLLVQPAVFVPTQEIFQSPELTRNSKPLKIDGFSPGLSYCPGGRSDLGMAMVKGRNDLQPVTVSLYPAVGLAIEALREAASSCGGDPDQVRMSGSGACIFLPVDEPLDEPVGQPVGQPEGRPGLGAELLRRFKQISDAQDTLGDRRQGLTRAWVVNSLPEHPIKNCRPDIFQAGDRVG